MNQLPTVIGAFKTVLKGEPLPYYTLACLDGKGNKIEILLLGNMKIRQVRVKKWSQPLTFFCHRPDVLFRTDKFFYAGGLRVVDLQAGLIIFESFAFNPKAIKDKAPLYVFQGPSCLGKSWLASQLRDMNVLETDALPDGRIPEDLSYYDVVVMGNRWVTALPPTPDREVVYVSFSRDKC
jgi:hypothetical protein